MGNNWLGPLADKKVVVIRTRSEHGEEIVNGQLIRGHLRIRKAMIEQGIYQDECPDHSKGTNDYVYEAGRWCWRANLYRAMQAQYVIITIEQEICGIYENLKWSDACPNCPQTKKCPLPKERILFTGTSVSDPCISALIGKNIPNDLIKQNPVKYINM